VLLDEGDLLDTERLRVSIERIETLGYVAVRGVRLTPSARAPQALDVWFEVEPRPVVRYGLVGGVNGLEGASLTGVLGTVNFFGRGERVFASAQFGEDVTALDLAGSRPYAFGTPWTLGFQVQKERLDLDAVSGRPPYTHDEWAVRAQAQRALGGRATVWAGYALSTVRVEAHEVEMQPAGFGRRRENELSWTVRFDGWDHPWKPLRGLRATGSVQSAVGTVDYAKARARSFALAPLAQRLALGLGAEAGWLAAIGSGQVLPFDERFLLGGETDLRGFDVRSVGPRDGSGTLIGGTRYLVLQGEAHVDVTRWLRAVAFVDAGQAWNAGLSPRVRDLRVSAGAEARFAMPVFRLPVRLIYAKNLARDELHPRSGFHIAIGPLP
jgi:outer membrane protein insertion porin family